MATWGGVAARGSNRDTGQEDRNSGDVLDISVEDGWSVCGVRSIGESCRQMGAGRWGWGGEQITAIGRCQLSF